MQRLYRQLGNLLLLCLLLASGTVAAQQGLLWHISGKGADSYLFGTMHSEDPRVSHLSSVVEPYLQRAELLMLEVSLDPQTEMAVAMQMMLPTESSLSALVGEELSGRVKQAMLERGVPPEVTERLQPWATVLTLSMPEQSGGQILDKLLYQRALASGKEFKPLESVEEQLGIFSSLSVAEQKRLLQGVLDEYKSYPQLFEKMTDAYLNRDLEGLLAMNEEYSLSHDFELQQKVMARLLQQRNHRMAGRIVPQLDKGQVFVAVGALHLPGEEGLIQLLRQRGYTVEALY